MQVLICDLKKNILFNPYLLNTAFKKIKKMQSVFWFTGRSHSGKSTLTRRIKEILDKEFSVHILDGDELVNSLGGHNFRILHHDDFVEKVLVLADSFSSKNKVVLVSLVTPKEKQRTRIREVLGDRYNELYIQCPKQVCYGRQNQRDQRVRKKNPTRCYKISKEFFICS